jgi:hypothetical protein
LVMPVIPSDFAMLLEATLGGVLAGSWRKGEVGCILEKESL